MSFLYFVPTGEDKSPIDYAFDGKASERGVKGEGPGDGRAGMLYGDKSHFDGNIMRLAFKAGIQTWRKIPNSSCMVGWYADKLPAIDELKRKQQIPGRVVEGVHIPISRSWNDEGQYIVELPRYVDVSDDGDPVRGEVVKSCRHAWELSQTILDGVVGDEIDNAQAILYAWEIIALNYRVGPVECSVMELLEVTTCWNYINAFLEFDQLAEIKKKAQAETASSSAGNVDETQSIAQAR